MITTAQRFADEMNARRVLRERGADADVFAPWLSVDAICKRYLVGSNMSPPGVYPQFIEMVDGSVAKLGEGNRWEA